MNTIQKSGAKASIRQKLLLLSFVILTGNAILGYAVYKSYQKLLDSEQWVRNSEQVISLSGNILSQGKDIETFSMGFIITKKAKFLNSLRAAEKASAVYITQLKQLTSDNARQKLRVDSLALYMGTHVSASFQNDDLKSKQVLDSAITYTANNADTRYTDRIRQITTDIQQEEVTLLEQRKQTNKRNEAAFNLFSIVVFILMSVFTILLLVAIAKYLLQNEEKEKRAAELLSANKELSFQNEEKEKRARELTIANKELAFQNTEKEKRAAELTIANKELAFQNEEKEKRAAELTIANNELAFQNKEKENRAAELVIANKELAFQNTEKEKRAAELVIANKELAFQNEEKERRAAEKKIAEKQLEFDKYNLDALINNTHDLMWSVDTDFKLITSNQPYDVMIKRLSGKSFVKGKDILSSGFSSEKRIQYKEFYERAFAGETFTEILHADIPNDSWSETSYYPILKGNHVIGTACFSRDITKGKLADLERAKITNDLTQRNKDLEQFAYIVSHNLRAPVANILGAARGLNYVGLSSEKKEILRLGLNESVTKLDDVIKDLNHILQIKRELNETKETVHFSTLVGDIKISIKDLIEGNNIKIQYDFFEIDEFLAVKSYLYSIFYNLISNSIKYRRSQIPCIIDIKSHLIKDKIVLIFTDNGMGIDLSKKGDQVFGLYKRFHTDIEGKGMGLFMVKTQVETLGGNISIKSEVDEGTEFKIEF